MDIILIIGTNESAFLFLLITGVPYIVFLSLLMTALTVKIETMGITGMEISPAVVIPAFNLITIYCAVLMLKNIIR